LLPHYTKGTPSQFRIALTAYMSANSGSISPVIYLLFIVSFTVLFTIAEYAILSLEDGSPFISNSSYTVLLLHNLQHHWLSSRSKIGTQQYSKFIKITIITPQDFHLLWVSIPRYWYYNGHLGYSYFARRYYKSLGWFPFL